MRGVPSYDIHWALEFGRRAMQSTVVAVMVSQWFLPYGVPAYPTIQSDGRSTMTFTIISATESFRKSTASLPKHGYTVSDRDKSDPINRLR
jgi:hypothetical protein